MMDYYTLSIEKDGVDVFTIKVYLTLTPIKIGLSDSTTDMLLDTLDNVEKFQELLSSQFNLEVQIIQIEVVE